MVDLTTKDLENMLCMDAMSSSLLLDIDQGIIGLFIGSLMSEFKCSTIEALKKKNDCAKFRLKFIEILNAQHFVTYDSVMAHLYSLHTRRLNIKHRYIRMNSHGHRTKRKSVQRRMSLNCIESPK